MAGFAKRLVFSAVFGPPRKRTEAAVPAQYLELIPTSRSYSLPAFYLKTPHPYGLYAIRSTWIPHSCRPTVYSLPIATDPTRSTTDCRCVTYA